MKPAVGNSQNKYASAF